MPGNEGERKIKWYESINWWSFVPIEDAVERRRDKKAPSGRWKEEGKREGFFSLLGEGPPGGPVGPGPLRPRGHLQIPPSRPLSQHVWISLKSRLIDCKAQSAPLRDPEDNELFIDLERRCWFDGDMATRKQFNWAIWIQAEPFPPARRSPNCLQLKFVETGSIFGDLFSPQYFTANWTPTPALPCLALRGRPLNSKRFSP